MKRSKSTLKNALRCNALFSITCAIILLIFSQPIATLIGKVDSKILFILGLGLFSFVVFILSVSESKIIKRKHVISIIIMDLCWVLSSVILLILPYNWFSATGKTIIVIIAICVGFVAYLQFKGLKIETQ